ncbi:MAG: glycosyltransferase [Alphaproteobacteria bacterium]|nr:glycosyltransferase [Alphaproteobacteria bacterium]
MKFVIFGLTISSSWGNGHATLWRGLCRALIRQGHDIVFFERDVPYYAANRDLDELRGGELRLYADWPDAIVLARKPLAEADVTIVTSYCPDGIVAGELTLTAPRAVHVFYDLDTPVTLSRLSAGQEIGYIGPRGLADFDLVLSYTGGGALTALQDRLGARRVAPLFGHVDPEEHRPAEPADRYRADLSYLGTYAEDRHHALEAFLIEPARRASHRRFLIGGASYPARFPWTPNLFFVRHLPPSEHPAFFSSSRLTLNITRPAMAEMGFCPSGRLFEAAACGAPILSDAWKGLDHFFEPGRQILVARSTEEVIAALELSDVELRRMADAAQARVLDQHTSDHRVADLERALNETRRAAPVPVMEA